MGLFYLCKIIQAYKAFAVHKLLILLVFNSNKNFIAM